MSIPFKGSPSFERIRSRFNNDFPFDVFGGTNPLERVKYKPIPPDQAKREDADAIRGDWQRVGQDLGNIMGLKMRPRPRK